MARKSLAYELAGALKVQIAAEIKINLRHFNIYR